MTDPQAPGTVRTSLGASEVHSPDAPGQQAYTSVCDDPAAVRETARANALVIECTGAGGATHSFLPIEVNAGRLWVARRSHRGDAHSWTVDAAVEETIENCIRRCDPDVRLVSQADSAFASEGES